MWALDAVEDGDGRCELLSGSGDSQLVRWADVSEERQRDASAAQAQELLAQQQFRTRCARASLAPPSAPPSRSASRARSAAPSTACSRRAAATTRCAQRWRARRRGHQVLPRGAARLEHDGDALAERAAPPPRHPQGAHRRAARGAPRREGARRGDLAVLERHYERVDRLVQSAYFVEFTLRAMGMILPRADAVGDAANGDPPAAAADDDDADAAEDDDDAEAAAAAAAELAAAKKARAARAAGARPPAAGRGRRGGGPRSAHRLSFVRRPARSQDSSRLDPSCHRIRGFDRYTPMRSPRNRMFPSQNSPTRLKMLFLAGQTMGFASNPNMGYLTKSPGAAGVGA